VITSVVTLYQVEAARLPLPTAATARVENESFAGPHFRDGYKKGYKIGVLAPEQ
jgi:hypothetical protein